MGKYFNSQTQRSFSPVAPVGVLEQLQARNELGYYNLLLAHNIVENRSRFSGLVENQALAGTWFIDNSVIELGYPVKPEVSAEAWWTIKNAGSTYSEVVCVLPDELLDGPATIQVGWEAHHKLTRKGVDNLMFVPQGKSLPEIIACAEAFQNCREVKWIGVAKNFVKILGSRHDVTIILQSIFPAAKFHMLGFSRDTIDDVMCARLPGVQGIDSSMPLRADAPLHFYSAFPKRGDWWNEDMQLTEDMVKNIKQVRKWLGCPV